jgi:hypothetical protein
VRRTHQLELCAFFRDVALHWPTTGARHSRDRSRFIAIVSDAGPSRLVVSQCEMGPWPPLGTGTPEVFFDRNSSLPPQPRGRYHGVTA